MNKDRFPRIQGTLLNDISHHDLVWLIEELRKTRRALFADGYARTDTGRWRKVTEMERAQAAAARGT